MRSTSSPGTPNNDRQEMKENARMSDVQLTYDHLRFAQPFKYPLTKIGERLGAKTIHYLNSALSYLEVGRWMRAQGYDVSRRVHRREQLFDLVGREVGDREVLYLEFGVAEGAATMYWSKLLRHPSSKLHGFDSFEGLPEDWSVLVPKGTYSAGGALPRIDDPRVQFFKGLFDQTLPLYHVPVHEVLVLIMDADLYSSTIYVLNALKDEIVPGTYIYFDEFNDRAGELRAFDELIKTTGKKFSLLGASVALEYVLFKCVP
jgi:hypothetical protein